MAIKAKDIRQLLEQLREDNKDNDSYPRLKLNGNELEVIIDNKTYKGSKEEMYAKFKDVPFFI